MHTTIIKINGFEYEAEIGYDYTPGCKGSTENGVPMEPDEGPTVEINSIKLIEPGNSFGIDLPEAVREEIEDEILAEYH